MLKKRTLVKLLIAVPIVWIVVLLFVGLNDSSTQPKQLQADKEKIKKLEQENDHLIAIAAQKHDEERKRLRENQQAHLALNNDDNNQNNDNDHPEAERIKAEEQQKKPQGPIQINAPVEKNPNAHGELGKPVNIDKEKLSPSERIKYDEGWTNNAFNQYASDMISLHRSLADIRDPALVLFRLNKQTKNSIKKNFLFYLFK